MLILGYGNFTSIFNKRHRRRFAAAVSGEEMGSALGSQPEAAALRPARQTGQKAALPTGKSTLGVRALTGVGLGGFSVLCAPTKPALKSVQLPTLGTVYVGAGPAGRGRSVCSYLGSMRKKTPLRLQS